MSEDVPRDEDRERPEAAAHSSEALSEPATDAGEGSDASGGPEGAAAQRGESTWLSAAPSSRELVAGPADPTVPRVPPPAASPPARRRPLAWATLTIVALLVTIEAVASLLAASGKPAHEWLAVRFGHARIPVWEGEVWRLVTGTMLHGAFIHIAANCLGIIAFGWPIERWIGWRRLLVLYGVSAVGGALSFQAFSAGGLGIGASGALCGLIPTFLMLRLGRLQGDRLALGRRFWRWFAILCVLLWLDSAVAGQLFPGVEVADSAHFGGLVAGLVAGIWTLSPRRGRGRRMRVRALALGTVGAIALVIYGFAFPVFDWTWYLWRAERDFQSVETDHDFVAAMQERARYFGGDDAAVEIVRLEAARGRLEKAWSYWRMRPPTDPERRLEAGFLLYDALFASQGDGEDARQLLATLTAIVDERIAARGIATSSVEEIASGGGLEDAALLNEAAWFRALREEELDVALEYAEKAVAIAPSNPSIRNTLGWVHFVRGEIAPALENLEAAIVQPTDRPAQDGEPGLVDFLRRTVDASVHRLDREVDPAQASCYLYLGIALWQTGNVERARQAVEVARRLDVFLMPHERRLLRDLESSL